MRKAFMIVAMVIFGLTIKTKAQPAAAPLFADVTDSVGLTLLHRPELDIMRMGVGTGAAWLDFDDDGDIDLYVTQGDGANALFRNDGGSFVDVADVLGASDAEHAGAGVAVADYNNDGWPDLYLANCDADVLLRNESGLGFTDVTAEAGFPIGERERGTSAAWGDYDGDGFLDLYVTNHMDTRGLSYSSQDRLYHNNGDGTFDDVSYLLGIERISGYGFIGGWTDFDNDLDADLLLINDCPFGEAGRYQPVYLFRNDGGADPLQWSFSEIGQAAGASYCRHGMGLATGDYNRDGWLDYFFTNIGKKTTLLTNSEGVFQDRAQEAGVYVGLDPGDPGAPIQGTFSWGATFFDFDRDGRQDLFVAAGTLLLNTQSSADPQPNALFRNAGDGTFADVSPGSGVALNERSRTSVVGDYDGDGDLDLFLVNAGETVHLFRNDSETGRHYLAVNLVGTKSNRDGIGARVIASTSDGVSQHVEIKSGSSLGGSDARMAFFGLDEHDRVDKLEVLWPSGGTSVLENVAANQRVTITEADLSTTVDEDPRPPVPVLAAYPNPTPGRTTVEYRLARSGSVRIVAYDVLGRVVTEVEDGYRSPGLHRVEWDGRDSSGRSVGSGIYMIRLHYGEATFNVTVVHVR